MCTPFRTSLRLNDVTRSSYSRRASPLTHIHRTVSRVAIYRFEETIGGQPYLIEVEAVAANRWRAGIVRRPGMPTALMPFYGATPADAAERLTAWLARAYEQRSTAN